MILILGCLTAFSFLTALSLLELICKHNIRGFPSASHCEKSAKQFGSILSMVPLPWTEKARRGTLPFRTCPCTDAEAEEQGIFITIAHLDRTRLSRYRNGFAESDCNTWVDRR